MKYISLFSGIEACSAAWHDLGWQPVAFAEFDDFPSAVLAHHYPDVPNLGDVTKVKWNEYKGKAQLIVGGSPCQSFSVAGKRLGMDDPRGNLALHYLEIIRTVQPKWFIYENVPGLLSSDGGRDFATFLGEVAKCGYGFAYRVLDAQNFGVPQRRRRVFVVGCADGDWRSAAAVLFERESLCGDSKKGKKEGEGFTSFIGKGTTRASEPIQPTEEGIGSTADKKDVAFDWENISQTKPSEKNTDPITTEGQLAIVTKSFIKTGFAKYEEGDEKSATLVSRGGSDGSSTLVQQSTAGVPTAMQKGIIHCADVGPAMGASGPPYSRTGNERVESEALVVQAPMHDPSPTLDASYGVGAGMRAGIERQCIGVRVEPPTNSKTQNQEKDVIAFTTEQTPKTAINTAHTLTKTTSKHTQCVMAERIFHDENAFGQYKISNLCGTLRTNENKNWSKIVAEPIGFSHTQGLDAQPSTDVFPTLRAGGGGQAVVFNIDSEGGNSMKSPNPHSGVQKVDKAATLTTFKPAPEDYRGGNAIVHKVIPIQEKATRHSGGGKGRKDDGAGNALGVGKEGQSMFSLDTAGNHAVYQESAGVVSKGNGEVWETNERHMSLTSGGGQAGQGYPAVRQSQTKALDATHVVRRLTPTECERLQGFPDGWTQIPYKGKPAEECPQTHRYKALGNSMAVPVMKWIAERIDMVESLDLSERENSKTTKQLSLW